MKYYKYSQLVKEYNVSDKTIRNWVDASLEGKVDLKLFEKNGRHYVANTAANLTVLNSLAEHGKKYRNSRSFKAVEASEDFYHMLGRDKVLDVVNTLDKNHELPWEYSYFGAAAEYWDEYLMELHAAGPGNLITNTIESLKSSTAYIDSLIAKYDKVNVINLCAGNNIAIHDFLGHIKSTGKLNRFVAVDISPDMLDIAAKNVDRWFSGAVVTEKVIADVRHRPLNDIVGEVDGSTINIFMMVAGPIVNFQHPERVLQTVNASMGKDDLLITTIKRDLPKTRSFFDFNIKSDDSLLGFRRLKFLELLNIDESLYEIEQQYDDKTNMRLMGIKPIINLTIMFNLAGIKKAVELERGDKILMWRAHCMTDNALLGHLNDAGFSQLLAIQSTDNEVLLTLSRPNDVRKDFVG